MIRKAEHHADGFLSCVGKNVAGHTVICLAVTSSPLPACIISCHPRSLNTAQAQAFLYLLYSPDILVLHIRAKNIIYRLTMSLASLPEIPM